MTTITEKDARFLVDNVETEADPTKKAEMLKALSGYGEQRKSSGLPMFGLSAAQKAESFKRQEQVFGAGLDGIAETMPVEERQAYTDAVSRSANPNQLKARVAIKGYLREAMPDSVKHFDNNWEGVRNSYAKQEFGIDGGVTDEKLYGLIGGKMKDDRVYKDQLGDLSQKVVQSVMEGDENWLPEWQSIAGTFTDGKKRDEARKVAESVFKRVFEKIEPLRPVVDIGKAYYTMAAKGITDVNQMSEQVEEMAGLRQSFIDALYGLSGEERELAYQVAVLSAVKVTPQRTGEEGEAGIAEKSAIAMERMISDMPKKAAAFTKQMIMSGVRAYGKMDGNSDAVGGVDIAREEATVARMVDDGLVGAVDPVMASGIAETMAIGTMQSLPYMATVATGYGIPLALASMAEDSRSQFEQAGFSPDESVAMGFISGAIQSGIERIPANLVFKGKIPFEKVIAKWLHAPVLTKGAMVKRLATTGGIALTTENLEELGQDLTPAVIQEVGSWLTDTGSGIKWTGVGGELEILKEARVDTFIALVPLVLVGTGTASFKDAAFGREYLKNRVKLMAVGFSEEAANEVLDAPSLKVAEKLVVDGWNDETKRNAGLEDNLSLKEQDDYYQSIHDGTITEGGAKAVLLEDGSYEVLDDQGEVIDVATTPEAATHLMEEWNSAQHVTQGQAIQEMITYVEKFQESGQSIEVSEERKTMQDRVDRGDITQEEAESIVELYISMGRLGVGSTPSDAAIEGENKVTRYDARRGVMEDVSTIYRDGSPLTVIEEHTEGYLKRRVADGDFTIGDVQAWRNEVEGTTEAKSERELIEWFSEQAQAYIVGKQTDASIPASFRAFLRAMREYIGKIMDASVRLMAMEAKGELNGDFRTHLSRAVGLDAGYLEQLRRQEEMSGMEENGEEIGAWLKGKLPHPDTAKANGETFAAELKDFYDAMKNRQAAAAFFAKKGEYIPLDTLASEARAAGFEVETAMDLLLAFDNSIKGIPMYSSGQGALDDSTFSLAPVNRPAFYSKLGQVVAEKLKGKTANVQQIKAAIDPAKGSGVKAEEIKWSGVMVEIDRLAEANDGKVPVDQLKTYLENEGRVKFEEVVLSEKDTQKKRKELEDEDQSIRRGMMEELASEPTLADDRESYFKSEYARLAEIADELGNMPIRDLSGGAQYADHQLEGGENYREVVLTMPVKEGAETPAEQLKRLQETYGVDSWYDLTDSQKEELRISDEKANRPRIDYTSSHFSGVPNYVAHSRMNERVDVDGNEGLFIEELQSDRHQAGRKEGYRVDKEAKFRDLIAERNSLPDGKEKDALNVQIDEMAVEDVGVADAPFRKDWPLAMFKRALRDAVAGGKAWIGWTTGETQAARYDLSKQIDSVSFTTWPAKGEGMGILNGFKNGEEVLQETIHENKLEDYVGKEVAKRLMAAELDIGGRRTLRGEDLKVGGEGMIGFYDKMLPKMVGKYVKQWGAKVGTRELNAVADAGGGFEIGEAGVQKSGVGNRVEVHSVEITDAMRESVAGIGQSTFSLAPAPDTPAFKKWFKESSVTDAEGEPLSVYHGTGAKSEEGFAFDYSKIGDQGRSEGQGFYFTDDKSVASGYAYNGGTVLEVYLSIQKPMELDQKGLNEEELVPLLNRIADLEMAADPEQESLEDGWLSNFGSVEYAAELISKDEEFLEQLGGIMGSGVDPAHINKAVHEITGFDGVRTDGFDNAGLAGGKIFVAFFPEQVKSVKNTGAFDPENPDITFSLAQTDAAYMAAVEDGDTEVAQAMVDEAANELEGVFHGGTAGGKGHIALFVDNVEASYWTGGPPAKRGGSVFGLYTLTGDLREVTDEMAEFYREYYADASGQEFDSEEAWDALNPSDIIDTADAWDDPQFVSELWQKFEADFMENGDAFSTPDGAVAFPESDQIQFIDTSPVTYDESGAVIPLSQRFNDADPRITHGLVPVGRGEEIKRVMRGRSASVRISNSEAFDAPVREALENDLQQVINNKVTVDEALKAIQTLGVEEASRSVMSNTSDYPPNVQVAMGMALLEHFNSTKDYSAAIDIGMRVSEIGTELGRGIQFFTRLGRVLDTPEKAQIFLGKQINKAEAALRAKQPAIDAAGEELRDIQKSALKLLKEWLAEINGTAAITRRKPVRVEDFPEITFSIRPVSKQVRGSGLISTVSRMLGESHPSDIETQLVSRYGEGISEMVPSIFLEAQKMRMKRASAGSRKAQKKAKKTKAEKGENKESVAVMSPELVDDALREIRAAGRKSEIQMDFTRIDEHFRGERMSEAEIEQSLAMGRAMGFTEDQTTLEGLEGFMEAMEKRIVDSLKERNIETPTQVRDAVRGLFEKHGLTLTQKDIKEAFAEKWKMPKATAEQVATISRLAENIASTPDNSAERTDATVELINKADEVLGSIDMVDKAWAVLYANILSGYPTHIRNTYANLMEQSIALPLYAARANPITSLLMVREMFYGIKSGASMGVMEAKEKMTTGNTSILRPEENKYSQAGTLERFDFAGGNKNPYNQLKYVGRALVAEDLIAFATAQEAIARMVALEMALKRKLKGEERAAYIEELLNNTDEQIGDFQERASREWDNLNAELKEGRDKAKWVERRVAELRIRERDGDLIERASEFAARVTFNYQPEGVVGVIANSINNYFSAVNIIDTRTGGGKVLKGLASTPRLVFMFNRIAANVTNRWIDYSGLGLAKGLLFSQKLTGGAKSGVKLEAKSIDERAMELKRGTVGLMLIGSFLMGFADPDDPDALIQIHGSGSGNYGRSRDLNGPRWVPFSVELRTGGKDGGSIFLPFQYTPFGLLFAIIGKFHDTKRYKKMDEEELFERLAMAMVGSGEVLLNTSFMSGAANVMNLFSKDEQTTAKAFYSFIARTVNPINAIPYSNFIRSVDKTFDPVQRDRVTIKAALMSYVPMASRYNKPAIDVLGDVIVNRPLDWFYKSEEDGTPEARIYKAFAKHNIIPSSTWSYKGRMPADMFYEFSKERGQILKAMLLKNGAARLTLLENMDADNAKAELSDISQDAVWRAKKAVMFFEYERLEKIKKENGK